MPGQLLPPCYQQATRPEFRSFRARGFTGGPGPAPSPAHLLPRGRGARPPRPRDPASLRPGTLPAGGSGWWWCLFAEPFLQRRSAAFSLSFAKWQGLTGSFTLPGLPDTPESQQDEESRAAIFSYGVPEAPSLKVTSGRKEKEK